MYLRTPKRYRKQRRQLRLFSGRSVAMLALTAVIAMIGWLIWQNQGRVRSSVLPQIEEVAQAAQTLVAPKPTPTATPDLLAAQTGCSDAFSTGNVPEAIRQCTVLATGEPNNVELHYLITQMLVINSNFGADKARIQQAMDFAEKTINANPEAPHGWAIRAMVLDWSGDVGRALASALQAKWLDESFAPTYAFLGEIYHDLGYDDVALSYLDQALKLDSTGIATAYIFRTRGLIYSSRGEWSEAIEPYETAMEYAPTQSYIVVELANNYAVLDQTDTAIQLLSEALERNPSDTSLLFKLATTYQSNGNVERAYEYYSRCLDVDRNNMLCLSWLGGLQWQDGDFATAMVNLKRAVELGSKDPVDFWQLGHALTALGRCSEAIPFLQQGYQIAAANEDSVNVERIATALQSCGVLTPGSGGSS